MAYSGLNDFIADLDRKGELLKVSSRVSPELEITEISDRVSKNGGKALLFENTGTSFPVLINAYGSDYRMALATGRSDLDDSAREMDELFRLLTSPAKSIAGKLSALPSLIRLAGLMPSRSRGKGSCQQVIHHDPDLGILPVLKCWPFDGGRYITLPVVHTIHPETGKPNAGMYRMQIIDRNTTAMHWQRHKTGANHYQAWKETGRRMPVSVVLGGDPVYAYAATAPLPEGIDEYILAGFLRKKRVKLVRCLTNELYVPADADIVIEGYVDPSEELFFEGPFGDHTGFYSLADWYPRFHVTCITHSRAAVYPATVVGVPPMEDAWIARATERIFLSPVKMAMQPEVEDFHMPDAGVAHNLVIVKIRKNYPGQGMKVLSSLSGAGQMMFTKYIIAVSGEIDIRDYRALAIHVFRNTDMKRDLLFSHGPLDVLDHSSDTFSFGGKLGVDATEKHPEERAATRNGYYSGVQAAEQGSARGDRQQLTIYSLLENTGLPVAVIPVDSSLVTDTRKRVTELLETNGTADRHNLVLLVDHTVDPGDLQTVAWQVLGNSDPERDHFITGNTTLVLDGTIKAFRPGGFPRRWPNVVCSAEETIAKTDMLWDQLGLGSFIESPSLKYRKLLRDGNEELNIPGQPL